MARRALLIGCQTASLQGVHADIEVMADAIGGFGFEVRTLIESDATAAGIRNAYEELMQSCSGDDAALVYYSGHGGRWRNRWREQDPAVPTWLQFIVPTDWDAPADGGFAGILAEELAVLQTRLTERTRNVTTILDCCHSARMFRSTAVVPRALIERDLPWDQLAARWHAVRAMGQVAPADANPHAVQLVACAPDQSAYELPSTALGGTHGALTAALVQVLRRPQASGLSWRQVIELVRPAVLDLVPAQRPDLLGPNAARRLFTLTETDVTGALPVRQEAGSVWIEGAALFGIGEGDTYELRAPTVQQPLAEAVVEAVVGDRGRLALDRVLVESLPSGVLAHPLRVSLGRRPVLVAPEGHPDRGLVVGALRRSAAVRVADSGTAWVLATVALDEGGILLLDAGGAPLSATRRPVTDTGLRLVEAALVKLARATHVRELESGQGQAALPADVEVAFTRIDPQSGQDVPVDVGEHLYAGDTLVVRARNTAQQTRYVSVLDIGLTGAVALMTTAEPSGATVTPGEELVVGEDAGHALPGMGLFWPDGLPETGSRPETLLTLVADSPVAGLTALTQTGVKTRSLAPRSGLERLVEDLAVGTRDARPQASTAKTTRYRVYRFDFLLHPRARPAGGQEPVFEVDERPDPSFRLVTPRALAALPQQVAVRLSDLTVLSNRSLFKARVRVDTLVVTAGADGTQALQAHTFFVDRVKDGDRLPMDNVRIFTGPVQRFLDIAVWVSRADQQEIRLADLLAAELNSQEVAGALATLAALAVAAPAAAAITGSIAAVATLVRTGARLLNAYSGTSIGVYRTSLLPHERYGAGQPATRHPSQGTIAAQDLALAYEIVDTTPRP